MRLVLLGAGYCATRFAHALQKTSKDLHITTTSRSARDDKDHIVFEGAHSKALEDALLKATHVVHSIAPGPEGDRVFALYQDALQRAPNLSWFAYLSSTGVYGDQHGAWTDEQVACAPNNARRERRAAADLAWGSFAQQVAFALVRLRLAGIYGPGRSVFDTIEKGRARCIDKPEKFFNRCHVDDIVQVLLASMQKDRESTIYNVADGAPSRQHEPVQYAYKLLGKSAPPLIAFEDAEMSAMARSFYEGCVRIRSDKVRKALCIEWKYRSYVEGLDAIFSER